MRQRIIIADIKITIKNDYSQPPEDDNFPYDIKKERTHPEQLKEDIENLQLNNITDKDKWKVLHDELLRMIIDKLPHDSTHGANNKKTQPPPTSKNKN